MSEINPNGPWKVTTEGDCEGRTTRHLGAFSGPIDRIAFALSREAEYVLEFEPLVIKAAEDLPVVSKNAFIRLRVNSKDIDPAVMLRGRPVTSHAGKYYSSFQLNGTNYYDEFLSTTLAKQAIGKLSKEELAALKYQLGVVEG